VASIDEEEEEELNDAGGRETPPEAIGGRFKDDHRQRVQGMGMKSVRGRHLCRRVEEGGASTASKEVEARGGRRHPKRVCPVWCV
jgi:hypothetical protein